MNTSVGIIHHTTTDLLFSISFQEIKAFHQNKDGRLILRFPGSIDTYDVSYIITDEYVTNIYLRKGSTSHRPDGFYDHGDGTFAHNSSCVHIPYISVWNFEKNFSDSVELYRGSGNEAYEKCFVLKVKN